MDNEIVSALETGSGLTKDRAWYLQTFQQRIALLRPASQIGVTEDVMRIPEIGIKVLRITEVVLQLNADSQGKRIDILVAQNPNKVPRWGNHKLIFN